MPPIGKVLPKHQETWILWLIILVAVFPLYYIWWPYADLNILYENDRWKECPWGKEFCYKLSVDSAGARELQVRAPAYVADFTEMPLEVKVTNILTETLRDIDAIVSVKVKPVDPAEERVHVRLAELGGNLEAAHQYNRATCEQNSAAFFDIPPGGETLATFMIRVSGGSEGSEYAITVLVEGEIVQPINYQTTFDRRKVFQLWLIKHLLFPPGANIFIPAVSLLFVCFGEGVYERVAPRKATDRVLWLTLFVLMVAFLILLYVWKPLGWFLLAAMVIFAIVGWWVGRGEKPPEEETEKKSHEPIKDAGQEG